MQHISIRSQISRSTIHIDKSAHPPGQSHLAALLTGVLSLSISLLISPSGLAQSAPEAEDSLTNYSPTCWPFFLEPHLPGNFALGEPNCSPKLKPPQIEKGRETYIILPFGEGATLQARISAANPPMPPLPSTPTAVDLNDWIMDIDLSWGEESSDEFSWEPVGRTLFDRMFNEPPKTGGGQVSILAPNLIPNLTPNLTPTNPKPTVVQYTSIDDFSQSPEHSVLSLLQNEYELTTEGGFILQTAILTAVLTSEIYNSSFSSTVSEVKSNESYGSSFPGSSFPGSSFLLADLPQPEVFEPFCQPVTTLFEEWSGSRNAWPSWPLRSVESLPSLQNPIFCSLTQNLKFQ